MEGLSASMTANFIGVFSFKICCKASRHVEIGPASWRPSMEVQRITHGHLSEQLLYCLQIFAGTEPYDHWKNILGITRAHYVNQPYMRALDISLLKTLYKPGQTLHNQGSSWMKVKIGNPITYKLECLRLFGQALLPSVLVLMDLCSNFDSWKCFSLANLGCSSTWNWPCESSIATLRVSQTLRALLSCVIRFHFHARR